jgi:uridylate kinase
MALFASAVGNVTVNVFAAVLSSPKFSTATAAFVVALYINAPLVVKLAGFQVTLLNVTIAVDPLKLGVTLVNVFPPATYPVPTTSSVVV